MNPVRCPWVKKGDPLSINYHDNEWGKPCYDSQKLFENLLLEIMQCGLNWHTVLKKRDYFREVSQDFSPQFLANIEERTFQELLHNPAGIRHHAKLRAWVNNAQAFLEIEKHTSFSEFIWLFSEGKPRVNIYEKLENIPSQTPISKKISASLKRHGFSFIGPITCYAWMQASGMVNDHLITCHQHPNHLKEKS